MLRMTCIRLSLASALLFSPALLSNLSRAAELHLAAWPSLFFASTVDLRAHEFGQTQTAAPAAVDAAASTAYGASWTTELKDANSTIAVAYGASPTTRPTDADSRIAASAGSPFCADASKARAVFFAGVEGSGHHVLEALYGHLVKAGRSRGLSLKGIKFPHQWKCGAKWTYEGTAMMKRTFADLVGPTEKGVVFTLPQQASYPECGIGHHASRMYDDHPRLMWIQEAARESRVDLHVILLYRPLTECLIADCKHRKFEPCAEQSRTLMQNAKELISQLLGLVSAGTGLHCFRYGDMHSMVAAVDRAYSPRGSVAMSSSAAFRKIWRSSHAPKPPSETIKIIPEEIRDAFMEADAALLRLCEQVGPL